MDAGQQRFGQVVDRFARRSDDGRTRRSIRPRRALRRGIRISPAIRALPAKREEPRPCQRADGDRKPEERAFGDRVQPAVTQHVRGARRQRRNEPIGDPELATQRDCGRLLHEERVGPRVDDPLVEPIGRDHPSDTGGCLENADAEAARLEIECRGQPGDSCTDDATSTSNQDAVVSLETRVRLTEGVVQTSSAQSPRRGVDVVREHLHVLHRCGRQDAVPQVEDVTGPRSDPREHRVGLLQHPRRPGPAAASGRDCPGPHARGRFGPTPHRSGYASRRRSRRRRHRAAPRGLSRCRCRNESSALAPPIASKIARVWGSANSR